MKKQENISSPKFPKWEHKRIKLDGTLTNTDIAKTIQEVEQYLLQSSVEEKLRTAVSIALEEIMLVYQSAMDTQKTFLLDFRKKSERVCLRFFVCGERLDPQIGDNIILHSLFETTDLSAPVWSYQNGYNQVVLTIPLYNTTLKNLKFVWSYVRQNKGPFFTALGCQFANVILNIVAPIVMAKIIVAFTDSAVEQIVLVALAIFAVNIAADLSLYLSLTRYNMVYIDILTKLRVELSSSILQMTDSCMQEKGGGLFIQRVTADTDTLAAGFVAIADPLAQMLRYIGVLIAMAVISPLVFIVALALIICQMFIEHIRTKKREKDDRIQRQKKERVYGIVSEIIRGQSDVKVLHCEDSLMTELSDRINVSTGNYLKMILHDCQFKLTRWSAGRIGKLLFTCFLAFLIQQAKMAPAIALVMFNYYAEFDVSALMLLGQVLEAVKGLDLSTERISAILNDPEFQKEEFGNQHLDDVRGEIRFENVRFCYDSADPKSPNREILKGMNFDIPAGETVAVVGKSGCGKSTIFRLICKQYDKHKGTIYIDGMDIRTLDKETIRGNITAVSQNPYFFNMSIRDNLRLAKPDATEADMCEVCRIAHIGDDIDRMPNGYDSIIGEGGVNLSGGQRQRLAIARCLLRDTAILLLDEATSALDNVTQKEIMDDLNKVKGKRTVVMIAHRLSTVVNADTILFMDNGKILDHGTHQELLARCEAYRELYEVEDSINRFADKQNA